MERLEGGLYIRRLGIYHMPPLWAEIHLVCMYMGVP